MVLVDGAVPATPTRIGQVPSDGPLKEALTSLARQYAVVLPGALVPTDDALGVRLPLGVTGRTAAVLRAVHAAPGRVFTAKTRRRSG